MERIDDPLKKLLARLQLDKPLQGWRAVEVWPEVAGEQVAARAQAVSCKEGILEVQVDSSAWMQELTYLKHRFVREMNRRLGDTVVRDIRLRPTSSRRP